MGTASVVIRLGRPSPREDLKWRRKSNRAPGRSPRRGRARGLVVPPPVPGSPQGPAARRREHGAGRKSLCRRVLYLRSSFTGRSYEWVVILGSCDGPSFTTRQEGQRDGLSVAWWDVG